MSRKVHTALDRVRLAELKAAQAIKDAYPTGARIRWRKSRGIQEGLVLGHSSFLRVFVLNTYSGIRYWIYARHIL